MAKLKTKKPSKFHWRKIRVQRWRDQQTQAQVDAEAAQLKALEESAAPTAMASPAQAMYPTGATVHVDADGNGQTEA